MTFTVIVGLGKTGLSCARYLSTKNEKFAVVDSRLQPPLLEEFKKEFPNVELGLGGLDHDCLLNASDIIVSPGVSLEEPEIQMAAKRRVKIYSDLDLFLQVNNKPIIAITGSNAKSTVTALVALMLKKAGVRSIAAGNFGTPVLDLLNQEPQDCYVLELSSFQLERCRPLHAKVATVLNVSEDHMDRYASLMEYGEVKRRIFSACETAVVNRADLLSYPDEKQNNHIISFGLDKSEKQNFGIIVKNHDQFLALGKGLLLNTKKLLVRGLHNVENTLAALAIGKGFGLPIKPMLEAICEFKGLPHRCEFVATKKGINYYNDSKATNPGATLAALKGLGECTEGKIVLIAGGDSKRADLSVLTPALAKYVKALVLMGKDANSFRKVNPDFIPVKDVMDMDMAVTAASELADHGDVVLLSPACASLDMFSSFEHRGDQFIRTVQQLI